MPSLRALADYRFSGKSERAVREEWIRPLLEHLGYGIDTLNDVRYEERLVLAQPLRRIGSTTIKVDYVPTVLGQGLWIIEAKAPEARDTWDEALGQAWTYATHPEIDVPLMAIADGTQIAVYDVTKPDWDSPVAALTTSELVTKFAHLIGVLGAANVAAKIRERQLRHLGVAMRAELDPVRLDETVLAVRRLADDARPTVLKNRASVLRDQFAREQRDAQEQARSIGIWGIAQRHNQPVPDALGDIPLAADYVRSLAEPLRSRELDKFVDAARPRWDLGTGKELPEPGPARMFWMLRVIALGTYLALVDEPGCGEHAAELARAALRDHLLDFPDDALARAAHRLERVLPPFVLRVALATEDLDLPKVASQIAEPLSDEARLRRRPDSDAMLLQLVSITCRSTFAQIPWTVDALSEAANQLELVTPRIRYRTGGARGQAGDPYMERYLSTDMLVAATLEVLGPGRLEMLDVDTRAALEKAAEGTDQTVRHWATAALGQTAN